MSRLPFESAVATGRGDDGTTGLLFGGDRVYKDDLRTEAFGAVDEAVAALGLARAELAHIGAAHARTRAFAGLAGLVLRIQRELFVVGAELATAPEARDRQKDGETRVSQAMVDAMDATLREMEAAIELPHEFVVPGETRASAGIEMARTILRRAERRSVTLALHDETLAAGRLLPYLNRLADLLWILARVAEQGEDRKATAARPGRSAAAGS
ncbi:MAG: cob(I)yrinic acid a,c-diamide adenosyltransferase [Candidatus Limnocylindrales bacterium]